MLNKTLQKISAWQFGLLMIVVVTASEILFAPRHASMFAKQDAWLSMALTILPGIFMVMLMTALLNRYPGLSIVEIGYRILGSWGGLLLAVFLSYSMFLNVATNLKSLTSFVKQYSLPQTPSLAIAGIFMSVCAIAVLAGIEIQGRCAELIVPINLLFIVLVLCFSIPNMKPDLIKPVLGNDILPILQGTVLPSFWILQGSFVMLGFILPFLGRLPAGRTISLYSVGFSVLLLVVITAHTLTVIGPFTSEMTYPVYNVVRMINIGDFFERIDIIISFVWLSGYFLKNSIFLYAFCHSVSRLFGLKDYRDIVIPLSVLSVLQVYWSFSGYEQMQEFSIHTLSITVWITYFLIPLALLVVDSMRVKGKV
ncbi:GerAB/ArcD/ProY family transporter [Paenibacillus spongiae]|uniref:Spore germination protein n=1 Tax=Paenibacillus spongiae TaxID=2909671 RepID=A0ABY5SF78_9BACL|nr:spore germination protein [Paenibacillus spongiae]UVI32631.1 spore germination protein [Paenibacillus spongiae]